MEVMVAENCAGKGDQQQGLVGGPAAGVAGQLRYVCGWGHIGEGGDELAD